MEQATTTVTLTLTTEQATTVFAALTAAAVQSRNHQLNYLNIHESPKVGPVSRAEAWQTFKKWEKHENECVEVCQHLQHLGFEPSFSAFNRFH